MTDGLHKGVKFRRQKLVFFHNERHLPDMIAKQTDILSIKKKKKTLPKSVCEVKRKKIKTTTPILKTSKNT